MAKSLGLKFHINHKDGHGEVYCGTIKDLLDKQYLKDFDVLKTLYKSKYK